MTHGHDSPNRLVSIAFQLRKYLDAEIGHLERPLKRRQDHSLPPAFEVAFLRGEAILRLRFFLTFETLGLGLEQPDLLLDLWAKLVLDRRRIVELAHRAGLVAALATQASLPEATDEHVFQLYCGLLDDLERRQDARLLELATGAFFRHHFRELFPRYAGAKPAVRKDRETLRFQAQTRLSKRHKQPVEIKESFQQEEHEVRFRLRVKIGDGEWQDQPEVTAGRLKGARMAAYKRLLKSVGVDLGAVGD
jgi:hypothetical protein